MGHLVFLLRVLHGSEESLSGHDQVDETHPCCSQVYGLLELFALSGSFVCFLHRLVRVPAQVILSTYFPYIYLYLHMYVYVVWSMALGLEHYGFLVPPWQDRPPNHIPFPKYTW